jgi:hypothetical protein
VAPCIEAWSELEQYIGGNVERSGVSGPCPGVDGSGSKTNSISVNSIIMLGSVDGKRLIFSSVCCKPDSL